MEETPFDLVAIAIELIVTLLVIGIIGRCLYIGAAMTQSYQREADIANSMSEYAMYTKYDATRLSGSDVIEAIHTYASVDFTVRVGTFDFNTGTWNLSDLIAGSGLRPPIHMTKDYDANIMVGANGDIIGIQFN